MYDHQILNLFTTITNMLTSIQAQRNDQRSQWQIIVWWKSEIILMLCLGCSGGEYQCDNGDCLDPSYVCDGVNDCSGAEDESDCKIATQ